MVEQYYKRRLGAEGRTGVGLFLNVTNIIQKGSEHFCGMFRTFSFLNEESDMGTIGERAEQYAVCRLETTDCRDKIDFFSWFDKIQS